MCILVGKERKNVKKGKIVTILLIVVLLLCAEIAGSLWFFNTHVFAGGKFYRADQEQLDLRNKKITIEEYNEISGAMTDCTVSWQVPFQGRYYPDDTTSLKVTNLSAEDLRVLSYFHELHDVDATECRNLDAVYALKERYPELNVKYSVQVDGSWYPYDVESLKVTNLTEQDAALVAELPNLKTVDASDCTSYEALVQLHENSDAHVIYNVPLNGQTVSSDTEQIAVTNPDLTQLMTNLAYLPQLKEVKLGETNSDAKQLRALREQYPDKKITWQKTVFGEVLDSEISVLDLSNHTMTTDEAAAIAEYFPVLQKIDMSFCGVENEAMAAFREKMRPNYKVVWTVIVTREKVKTDDIIFHSSGRHMSCIDQLSYDLQYCEDMIVVDIGHSQVKYVEWVRGMPNLKYLILADNWLMDITPLSSCKNLVYLELFINKYLKDISPLVGCTALEDVSVADTAVDVRPFADMPWLKNLWINNNPNCKAADVQYLTEKLPNTHIASGSMFTTGGGWRQLQNYYDMRNIMGLPCNSW